MQKFVQTIAMLASFLTLCAGLWQGWAFPVTLKKVVLAYLGIFLVGALMVLAIRVVGEFEPSGDSKALESNDKKPKGT